MKRSSSPARSGSLGVASRPGPRRSTMRRVSIVSMLMALVGSDDALADSESASHQFFEAMGLSMNMCGALAEKTALELGFQARRAPANAPKEARYFVNPAVRREQISFRTEANEGQLELADLSIFVSNRLTPEQITGEVEQIRALYGPDACRERSVNVVCQGTRYSGPYQMSLRAQYDEQWIRYTLRSRFQTNRFFEPSPVCINSAAPASALPDSSAVAESPPASDASSDAPDSSPATTSPAGPPSQPSSDDSQAPSPGSRQPPMKDSSISPGQPGQELFESAQAMEERADAQRSSELHAKAAELYKQAVAVGHVRAMFNLSRKYARGEGVEQSRETELELLEQAARAGVPEAQYNLASRYASGTGVPADQEKAVELLEAAAEAGDADAQLELAKRKLAGSGTGQSDQAAIEMLEKAAAGGNAEAQYLLGRILEEGILASRDVQQAEQYFCMAAAVHYEPAVEKCGRSFIPPNDTAKLGRQIRY